MYKHSGLLVIAALIIATMGILSPTTTVSATAPTVTLEPTSVQDNGYVLFTLTVTNSADENIENILIKDVSTGTTANFGENVDNNAPAIFGENVADNIENIRQALENSVVELNQVADNLEEARTNLTNAANMLAEVATHLRNAGTTMNSAGEDNYVKPAGADMKVAADDLALAATALLSDPVSLINVADNIRSAATNLGLAGAHLAGDTDNENIAFAGDNMNRLSEFLDQYVDNAIEETVFSSVADNNNGLENVAETFFKIASHFSAVNTDNLGGGDNAWHEIENVGVYLLLAAENLKLVNENICEAGAALSQVENLLENAENIMAMTQKSLVDGADSDRGVNIHITLLNAFFHENLQYAGIFMDNAFPDDGGSAVKYENVIAAGIAMDNAARQQTAWLGTNLASNIIGYDGELITNSVRYWIAMAGASLKDNDNVGLTAAASAFDNAASRMTSVASTINTLKGNLTPTTGWGVQPDEGGLLFMSLGEGFDNSDNCILPGVSKTFKFYWRAPDIDTAETHTIRVWTLDNDNNVLSTNDFSVVVDGTPASLDIRVYQTGVVDYMGNAVDNVVGKRLNDNKAVLELKSSKALSTFNTVKIENWQQEDENKYLYFSDFTTTDNMLFTYEFSVADWCDNAENVRVVIGGPSSTTSVGVENENEVALFFYVDMIDPAFAALAGDGTAEGGDNGLEQFEELTVIHKIGTDDEFYVTYQLSGWVIKGRVEDNDNVNGEGWEPGDNPDNDLWAITTVYVNGVAQTMSRLPDDNYSATVTLQEGVNSIRVVASDRVGNAIENKIDNVYCDNTRPTVTFVSVGGKAWTENEAKVSDNKPTIRLKITDPGFGTCTGLGIPFHRETTGLSGENCVQVLICQADNDSEDTNAIWREVLDNVGAWDNGLGTSDYNFENKYDNDNKGLQTGTWYVIVTVNDNLHENDNWVMSFIVDVTEPSAPASMTGSVTPGSTAAARTVITTTSIGLTGTSEGGATIKVEISTDNGVTWTEQTAAQATADSSGNWTTTITVTEGTVTGIRVKAVDDAGNTSTAATFGYVLADSTPPTVTITSPATGTTTDAASIAIQGTVTKDDWESWTDLTLTVQVGTDSVTVPISNGSFSYSVALAEGTNTIMASVTDGVNTTGTSSVNITRTVTPWATYAIIIVIVALILAAIAIFRKR